VGGALGESFRGARAPPRIAVTSAGIVPFYSRLPAVEVHLSDVDNREAFRRVSVLAGVCIARVAGKGPEGYRDALAHLKEAFTA